MIKFIIAIAVLWFLKDFLIKQQDHETKRSIKKNPILKSSADKVNQAAKELQKTYEKNFHKAL